MLKKICMLSPWLVAPPLMTGGEVLMWSTARALTKGGFHVEMVSYSPGEERAETFDGIEILAKSPPRKLTYRSRPWLLPLYLTGRRPSTAALNSFMILDLYRDPAFGRLLRSIDCDAVLLEAVGNIPCYARAHSLARLLGVPFLVHLSDIFSLYVLDENRPSFVTDLVARRIRKYELGWLREAETVLTVSKSDERVLKAGGVNNVQTILPSISPESLAQSNEGFEAAERRPLIVTAAGHRDRTRVIVDTVKTATALPGVGFALAGVDEAEPPRMGIRIPANLDLPGTLERPALNSLYEAATIVLAPLRMRTGISMRIVEALLHGKPVISTTSAAGKLTGSGVGGIAVEDDPENYSRLISSLLKNQLAYSRLATAARKAASTLSFDLMTGRYIEAIENLTLIEGC